MDLRFDQKYWEEKLKYPDWYIRLETNLNRHFLPLVHDQKDVKYFRWKIYRLIARLLSEDKIPLAKEGINFDIGRKPIDTLVIHHTEEKENISLEELSAIGLIRLYAAKYLDNNVLGFKLRGQPIWSGHFTNKKQVFYGYHWLVRADGSQECLLTDEVIGWHSGDWDTNTKSIGIALSGNYEHSIPPKIQLKGVAEIIRKNYSSVRLEKILGHLEVKESRTCPGDKFLSVWKNELIRFL